ncbi:hypothetical protein JCM33374_g4488 [Metschnikowia sp. JCM 33374]|nr:hypothetical protein JCM33374_g4488 [Metschnikowia sp. JCM 33374]
MKFSNIIAFGFATLAVATPVEKRDIPSLTSIENSAASAIGNLDNTGAAIIEDVEGLIKTIITDVEALAKAAGTDASAIWANSGIPLSKREESKKIEARDDQAIVSAANALIADILTELNKLSTSTGVSLVSTFLSTLGL